MTLRWKCSFNCALAFSKKSPLVLMNSCITYLDSRRWAVPIPFVYFVATLAGKLHVTLESSFCGKKYLLRFWL